jgi:uncharacterized protein YciI
LAAAAPAIAAEPPAPPAFDAALAQRLGADERGMRAYVLVILKSGPTPLAAGPERDAMFAGHFANIQRLADAGQLAVAGPLDRANEWRGLFILAVDDIEAAKALVDTDPVIKQGEMVAEFHKLYSSAALMLVNETHKRLSKPAE